MNLNIINLFLWSCILVYVLWNKNKFYVRIPNNRKYFLDMIIILCVYFIIDFCMGFLVGFAKSPYNHNITSILKNIIIKIVPIIGIELTRYVILARHKKNKVVIIFVTVLFMIAEINMNTLINLYSNKEELFKYICSTILPIIANSILYTYLSLNVSYIIVLIFRLREVIIFLLPILPDMDWFMTGSLSILLSFIVYILFKYKFAKKRKDTKRKRDIFIEKMSYLITIILLLMLVFFMLGIFKYEPIVILSNSMVPSFYRGDMLIFKKLNETELKNIPKNTIIIYSVADQNIAHRVIDRIKENDTVLYQTKGDNNNVADAKLVKIEQIKGIYVFNIKYVGFPSVWLYSYFSKE